MDELVLSRPRDARALRSRAALREALLALIAEKPLELISIREIALRAGVSFPTFYRQYPTRDALLDDIAASEIGELLAIPQPLMAQRDTRISSLAIVSFVSDRKDLWRTLLTTGATAAMREEFIRRSRDIAASQVRYNPGLPVDLMAPLVAGGMFEILSWWLRQTGDVPVGYVAQLLEILVIAPSVSRQDIALPKGAA